MGQYGRKWDGCPARPVRVEMTKNQHCKTPIAVPTVVPFVVPAVIASGHADIDAGCSPGQNIQVAQAAQDSETWDNVADRRRRFTFAMLEKRCAQRPSSKS